MNSEHSDGAYPRLVYPSSSSRYLANSKARTPRRTLRAPSVSRNIMMRCSSSRRAAERLISGRAAFSRWILQRAENAGTSPARCRYRVREPYILVRGGSRSARGMAGPSSASRPPLLSHEAILCLLCGRVHDGYAMWLGRWMESFGDMGQDIVEHDACLCCSAVSTGFVFR